MIAQSNVSHPENVLSLYIDTGATSSKDLDFDDAVSQELEELKKKTAHKRFRSLESGAKNVVFIQCEVPVSPDDLVHYMLTNIKASGIPCTRYSISEHYIVVMLF